MIGYSVGWLVGAFDWLVEAIVGLVGLVGRSVGWLVGWLVGGFVFFFPIPSAIFVTQIMGKIERALLTAFDG